MQRATLALTLTAAALLPSLAAAGVSDDPVRTSFERDLQREQTVQIARADAAEPDPLVEIFQAALDAPAPTGAGTAVAYAQHPCRRPASTIR